jgi:spore maturation protein CgeB
MKPLKIFYLAMEYDYGDPARGESFEEANFKSALVGMGHHVTHYDFMARKATIGTRPMRKEIVRKASEDAFDAVFIVLFTNELDGATLREIRSAAQAPTINWFADDHWRFDGFSKRMAKSLDWAVTTDADALPKYASAGIENTILSQWACNRYLYTPSSAPTNGLTTFVGQPHGTRRQVIEDLGTNGIDVTCFGQGWPNGRVSTSEMIRTFQESSINLNLANSSASPVHEVVYRKIMRIGGGFGQRPPQIKGRTFEIPGCGGFQLTESVPHLEKYFEVGREIATYSSTNDLTKQVRYWRSNDEERANVARAGFERVMREHTYDHRFEEIFRIVGLQ